MNFKQLLESKHGFVVGFRQLQQATYNSNSLNQYYLTDRRQSSQVTFRQQGILEEDCPVSGSVSPSFYHFQVSEASQQS